MSQQATYRAEIHELYTEMLNVREKSELQAVLSAKMCRVESPSLTVEAEPENVLNTPCPGRSPSWILPAELMTPARPTTGGVQSPSGPPVACGPSPVTQQYRHSLDHVHGLRSLLVVPGLATFGGLVPPLATVSLAQYVAAGVPVRSLVVSLRGPVLERCRIDASLGVLLLLVSIELELFSHGFLCFNRRLCSFCGLST